jgi:hypothetical protein
MTGARMPGSNATVYSSWAAVPAMREVEKRVLKK